MSKIKEVYNPFEDIKTQIQDLKNLLIETREKIEGASQSDIMNITQMSEFTGYSKSYLYRLVSSNEIPYVKKGAKLFFSKEVIRDWLFETRQPAS